LILLDEPTNGIDTSAIFVLKKLVKQAQQKKCMIVISSHILDFVETIATCNIFLKEGHILYETENKNDLNKLYQEFYINR